MNPQPPTGRERYARLFPDPATAERALDRLDLKTPVDDGLEARTVAVFRVAREIEDAHQPWLSVAAARRLFRCLVLLIAVGLLTARWFAGAGTHADVAAASRNPVARAWETVSQTVFSQPDYVARPPATVDRREDRLLAAFHQLAADLVEIVLWAVAIVTAILLVRDLVRRRRRPLSASPPLADGGP